MTLKIETMPQLTMHQAPRKGETGAHILAAHRKAETTAALVAAVKSSPAGRPVAYWLDMLAGRA